MPGTITSIILSILTVLLLLPHPGVPGHGDLHLQCPPAGGAGAGVEEEAAAFQLVPDQG